MTDFELKTDLRFVFLRSYNLAMLDLEKKYLELDTIDQDTLKKLLIDRIEESFKILIDKPNFGELVKA